MNFPRWASPSHPIARRETAAWRKTLRKWGWLAAPVILFVIVTSSCSLIGNLPLLALIQNQSPQEMIFVGFFFAQSIAQTIWNLNSAVQWLVDVAVGLGMTVTIARERETQNWELLRLTPVSVNEILLAKTTAILRQFRWPILLTTLVNTLGLPLLGAVVIAFTLLLNTLEPGLVPQDTQIATIVVVILSLFPALFLLWLNTLLNIVYNCSIGLAVSCSARTQANAVAFSLVTHFVLNTFILTPAFMIILIIAGAFGGLTGLLANSPLLAIILIIVIFAILFFAFRIAVIVAAVLYTRYQLQRLSE
ncbi:MAG: hypothetical protein HYZ49_07595 [Chloroflexi bacterium]|nr:hypothetical protein [Chloroflexota bacterium]